MKRGKVLVTGSGGFSGRKTLEMLKERGYDVRATDLAAPGSEYLEDRVDAVDQLKFPASPAVVGERDDFLAQAAS